MKPGTAIHALDIFLCVCDRSACDTNYACELASIKLHIITHGESKVNYAVLKSLRTKKQPMFI